MTLPADQGFAKYRDKKRFEALDGVLFFAIAAVLFHHSPLVGIGSPWSPLSLRGFLGVDLFFVISGFLITSLLLREHDRHGRIPLKGFYWRRALRIMPLYLLIVTTVGAYYTLVKQTPDVAQTWPFSYLVVMNLIPNHIPLLAPTWSLGVEEQYYLIWHVSPFVFSLANAFYPAMLLGSGLALMLHHRQSFAGVWSFLGNRWSAPTFALILIAELLFFPADLHGFPNLAMHLTLAAFVGALVIRKDAVLIPVMTFAPVRRIGVVSCGIYLMHLIALHVATIIVSLFLGEPNDVMVLFLVICVGLSWLLADISFRFYKPRFLSMRQKPLGGVERDLGMQVR